MAMNLKAILSVAAGGALLAGCAVDPYAYDSRYEYGYAYGGPTYYYGAPYGYYEPYYGGGLSLGYVYSDRDRYRHDGRRDQRHDRRWDDRRDDRRDPAPPPGPPSTGEPRYHDRWGPSPGGG